MMMMVVFKMSPRNNQIIRYDIGSDRPILYLSIVPPIENTNAANSDKALPLFLKIALIGSSTPFLLSDAFKV